MYKKTLLLNLEENTPVSCELEVLPVKQQLLIGPKKVPAYIAEDGSLWINFNSNFGYADFETYLKVKLTNPGTTPDWFNELDKYYIAARDGKLESVWQS